MDELNDRTVAWDRLERLLVDASQAQQSHDPDTGEHDPELPNPDDVLSIDCDRVARVLLTVGGPTVWIEYRFSVNGGDLDFTHAEYCTTDTPSGNVARVELQDSEAERLAEVYCHGLDMIAETLRGES